VTEARTAGRNWPLVVRPAQATDAEAVLDFATHTWDHWDYIPNAWPVWLTADDGTLLVAVPGKPSDSSQPCDREGQPLAIDRPVAVARVARTGADEAWLEGIRVDPRVRGMDVATDFQTAELHWATAFGATVVRYATGERNEGSHRLGARHGFAQLAAFASWWWTLDPESDPELPSSFRAEVRAETTRRRQGLLARLAGDGWVAEPADTEGPWQALSTDPTFLAGARLYEPRPWAMQELTRAGFERHVQRGEVLLNGSPEMDGSRRSALAIMLREQLPAEDSSLRLALLAGDGMRALQLAQRTRELAYEMIRFLVPVDAPMTADNEPEWQSLGFHRTEFRLHVLGRPLDPAHPAPAIDPARLELSDLPSVR
jgi:Acetyltransferase (GNAT) family